MHIMTDNWLLEEVADTLGDGLRRESEGEIQVDLECNAYTRPDIRAAVIQIEALFSFLLNIVLRDSIIVDQRFADGWNQLAEQSDSLAPFFELQRDGVIDVKNFEDDDSALAPIREALVDKICVTDDLKDITRRNSELYRETGENVDSFMSLCVWGGAGMLARASLLETTYVGHPHRHSLFNEVKLFANRPDATRTVLSDIDEVRASLIQYSSDVVTSNQLRIHVPAIVIEIIQDCNQVGDLLSVALQYRGKYRRLRRWLSQYQVALEKDDLKESVSKKSFLASYLKDQQKQLDLLESSSTGITVSAAWIKFPVPQKPYLALKNSFGVRSDFSKLLLRGSGLHAVRRLLSFFDEEKTQFGKEVEHALIERSARPLG